MFNVQVDKREVDVYLNRLTRTELPTALRNAVNDTARDIIKRESAETRRIFDNPTPFVQRAFRIEKKASKQDPTAVVWIKDVFGATGDVLPNVLTPHIPSYPATRRAKGMERALRRIGLMSESQFLVPSRTAKLDRYGNIRGSEASKMLNDLAAFANVAGFTSTTRAAKVKYIWGTVKSKNGGTVTGIWLQSRFFKQRANALVMLVVDRAPRYTKRFDYFRVAQTEANKKFPVNARLAVQFALKRRQ